MNRIIADFEFKCDLGGTPKPHTLCGKNLDTGETWKFGPGELPKACPFPPDHTLIAFAADAELGCYEVLGWNAEKVIDLRVEHMMLDLNIATEAHKDHLGTNLENALGYYGLSHTYPNKKELQALGGRGEPYTPEECELLKDYCWQDIAATEKLHTVLESRLDDSSLYRGLYMKAVAKIHHRGIPFDAEMLALLKKHADELRGIWLSKLDPDHEIFDEEGTFKIKRFAEYLRKRNLLDSWPRTAKTKQPSRDSDDLRDVIASNTGNEELVKLCELFNTINLLKNFKLYVGEDGRNRVTFFNPYGTKTGRNAQNGYVYMQAKWVRSLMKPREGYALAYVDWNSMEVGVGAWLSQDPRLIEAYNSGDAHMYLAKAAGEVPMDASKDEARTIYPPDVFAHHCFVRDQFKTCDLAAMYGATHTALMRKGLDEETAKRTLKYHHDVYTVFWEWMNDRIEEADFNGEASTLDCWRLKVDAEQPNFNPRSVGNFFVQANSASIMQLAAILATEQDLGVCAIIHDAFLLEAPIADMQRQVTALVECMKEACRTFLDGFELGVDGDQPSKWIVYPNHYSDKRGKSFWDEVVESVRILKAKHEYEAAHPELMPKPEPKPTVFCQYKYKASDMMFAFGEEVRYQIGDVCGVEASEDCKWCEDHCKKPDKCKVHKEPTVFDYEYVGG
jgi:DNA polymerase I-like protein with 3'-5' exonuclease and polymerase domains